MPPQDRSPADESGPRKAPKASNSGYRVVAAVILGSGISAIVYQATEFFGQPVSLVAASAGFLTATYYLSLQPSLRAVLGTGLTAAAILLAVAPLIWYIPQITTFGGEPPRPTDSGFGQGSILLASMLLTPAVSITALIIFVLGHGFTRTHHQQAISPPINDQSSSRLTHGYLAVLFGVLNALIIRILLDDLWYATGNIDPYHDLRDLLPVWGVLDRPMVIPWTAALIVFLTTAIYLAHRDNPRTIVTTGLYSTAALLAITPFGAVLADPTGFIQDLPAALIGIVLLGLGFYTTAAVLLIIGYNLKHRTAEPDPETGFSDTNSTR